MLLLAWSAMAQTNPSPATTGGWLSLPWSA